MKTSRLLATALAALIGAGALCAGSPAQAQPYPYHRHWHHGWHHDWHRHHVRHEIWRLRHGLPVR